MISDLLARIPPGDVRLVRRADAAQIAAELESEQGKSASRVVISHWPKLPRVDTMLDATVDALARSALALWPDWYGRTRTSVPERPADLGSLPNAVFRPWLEVALARCLADIVPRTPGFPLAIEAAQLALAIQPGELTILLGTGEDKPAPGKLLSLARAAEWLASHTLARVAVVVSADLSDNPELDAINFDALDLSPPRVDESLADQEREPEPEIWIWPLQGRPHPRSPGENLLAKKLGADPELAALFAFNQPVRSVRDHTYYVDLLWGSGRVVVEVDGYRYHRDAQSFRNDRHRDYELTITGYTTLRLPHDEVLADADYALQKIRDVVAYRRTQLQYSQGAPT